MCLFDRKNELKFLEDKHHTDEGQFFVIYGIYRVCKTELLRGFCKVFNYHPYF